MTKIGWRAFVNSTALESNKSHTPRFRVRKGPDLGTALEARVFSIRFGIRTRLEHEARRDMNLMDSGSALI